MLHVAQKVLVHQFVHIMCILEKYITEDRHKVSNLPSPLMSCYLKKPTGSLQITHALLSDHVVFHLVYMMTILPENSPKKGVTK